MINELPSPPVSPSPQQEPPIRAFTVYICEDCLALKGEMCHTPECRFCRRTMREVSAYLDVLLIRPIVDGQRLVADEGEPLAALPVGSPALTHSPEFEEALRKALNAPRLDTSNPKAVREWALKCADSFIAADEAERAEVGSPDRPAVIDCFAMADRLTALKLPSDELLADTVHDAATLLYELAAVGQPALHEEPK
jgi:hypothetical protein